jgi:serine-type D-Ala-D-Ala carboxypeptidase/endopeptidase (penicillin-binding protein 4)
LIGDLVLVGSGDFILGGRGVLEGQLQYPLAGLDKLASEVKAAGITSIKGDVLVNDKLWNPFMTKEGAVTSDATVQLTRRKADDAGAVGI